MVSELLEPLYDLLKQYVLMPGNGIAGPVQDSGSGKTRTARLWVYVRDDRNAGSQLPPAVWFAYSPDRRGIHPKQHLSGCSCILQADAYGGYNAFYEDGRITEAACMAHARRKIHNVHARMPTDVTTEALWRIGNRIGSRWRRMRSETEASAYVLPLSCLQSANAAIAISLN